MMRFATLALMIIVLAGCQAFTNFNQRFYGNEESPYFSVSVDSTLVLKQELTVPAKNASVWFQRGRAVTQFYEVHKYNPYCRLTLDTKRDVPQTIQPDEFVIRRVGQRDEFTVDGGFIQVAEIPRDGGFEAFQVKATRMELRSESQPDVVRLTCASWGLPQDMSHVTIREIRQTLGDIFALQLFTRSAGATPRIRRESEGSSY
ncbi:MAG: hypothetical protein ACE5NW_05580 [Acidiferrobacterales bacterium]